MEIPSAGATGGGPLGSWAEGGGRNRKEAEQLRETLQGAPQRSAVTCMWEGGEEK